MDSAPPPRRRAAARGRARPSRRLRNSNRGYESAGFHGWTNGAYLSGGISQPVFVCLRDRRSRSEPVRFARERALASRQGGRRGGEGSVVGTRSRGVAHAARWARPAARPPTGRAAMDAAQMQQLAALFAQTLAPAPEARKAAEAGLAQAAAQPGYGLACLQLAAAASAEATVRQSAAVAFKNHVKKVREPAARPCAMRHASS